MDSIKLLTQKNSTCSELLSCLFNLKNIDLEAFYSIAQKKHTTLNEISAAINRDKSSAHRCLSKLLSAGLLQRRTRTLKDGGYYHEYSVVEVSLIKKQTEIMVEDICYSLKNLVDNLESDFSLKIRDQSVN